MKFFIQKNMIGVVFFCIILLTSIGYTYYLITNTNSNENITKGILSFSNYKFFGMNNNIKIDYLNSRTMNVFWDVTSENDELYIQLFDGSLDKPPSSTFDKFSSIPSSKKIKFDFFANTNHGQLDIIVNYIEYDTKKRISENQKLLRINNNSRLYTVNFPINTNAKSYKLGFKILPESVETSELIISNLEIFYKQ